MSALRQWLLSILLRKEVQEMAVVYATLIIKGRKTMDQVPAPRPEERRAVYRQGRLYML